jgi:hypothetical protein
MAGVGGVDSGIRRENCSQHQIAVNDDFRCLRGNRSGLELLVSDKQLRIPELLRGIFSQDDSRFSEK